MEQPGTFNYVKVTFIDLREPQEFSTGDNDSIRLGWEQSSGTLTIYRSMFTQPHGRWSRSNVASYPDGEASVTEAREG